MTLTPEELARNAEERIAAAAALLAEAEALALSAADLSPDRFRAARLVETAVLADVASVKARAALDAVRRFLTETKQTRP